MFKMPITLLLLLTFLILKVRNYLVEVIINYLIIVYAVILYVLGKEFIAWNKPKDRFLLKGEMLIKNELI